MCCERQQTLPPKGAFPRSSLDGGKMTSISYFTGGLCHHFQKATNRFNPRLAE